MKKLFFIIVCSIHLHGKIIESHNIYDVNKHIDLSNTSKSLVILDIDNTLAAVKTLLGSDEWFEHLITQYAKVGMSRAQVVHLIQPFDTILQQLLTLHPVEGEHTIKMFNHLIDYGVSIVGLTARPPALAQRTYEQLKTIGIDFMRAPLHMNTIDLSENDPALYQHNIIFSGRVNKATSLSKLLDHLSLQISHGLFIDDKLKHVVGIDEKMKSRGTEIVCLHYKRLNEKANEFDFTRALQEAHILHSDLSTQGSIHADAIQELIGHMEHVRQNNYRS